MPTYEYRCTKCSHRFELFHGIKDETRKRCPRCRATARRVPAGGAGLIFKGSGFYITDYRSKSYKEKARAEKGTSGGPGSGAEKPSGSGSAPGSGGGTPSAPGPADRSSSGEKRGTSAPASRPAGAGKKTPAAD